VLYPGERYNKEKINVWMDHFGMYKFQCHCSGHAGSKVLLQIVSENADSPCFLVDNYPSMRRLVATSYTLFYAHFHKYYQEYKMALELAHFVSTNFTLALAT
jgi:hypothetical protein